jgi:hypothetical protein
VLRKIHEEELHNLYSSSNIIQEIKSRMRRTENVKAQVRKNVYKIMVPNPEGKTPLQRPRHRWGVIIKWRIGTGGRPL